MNALAHRLALLVAILLALGPAAAQARPPADAPLRQITPPPLPPPDDQRVDAEPQPRPPSVEPRTIDPASPAQAPSAVHAEGPRLVTGRLGFELIGGLVGELAGALLLGALSTQIQPGHGSVLLENIVIGATLGTFVGSGLGVLIAGQLAGAQVEVWGTALGATLGTAVGLIALAALSASPIALIGWGLMVVLPVLGATLGLELAQPPPGAAIARGRLPALPLWAARAPLELPWERAAR